LLLFPLAALVPAPALAQSPWSLTTRAVMTGSSDETRSEPEGYEVYSTFAIDAALGRRLGSSRFALEASVRTESREVSFREQPAGSFEAVPLNLTVQYRFGNDGVRPYVGAGLDLTVVWEKAGGLDSTDLTPSVAPVVQLGADVRISERAFFNVDLKWNPWRTDIESGGAEIGHLQIDPIVLGVGLGLRF
jgi:outer membrane protein W